MLEWLRIQMVLANCCRRQSVQACAMACAKIWTLRHCKEIKKKTNSVKYKVFVYILSLTLGTGDVNCKKYWNTTDNLWVCL